MTKAELLKALEPFEDDQYVYVEEFGFMGNDGVGAQLIIQGVKETSPWHPREGLKNLVGIVVHGENKELPKIILSQPIEAKPHMADNKPVEPKS